MLQQQMQGIMQQAGGQIGGMGMMPGQQQQQQQQQQAPRPQASAEPLTAESALAGFMTSASKNTPAAPVATAVVGADDGWGDFGAA